MAKKKEISDRLSDSFLAGNSADESFAKRNFGEQDESSEIFASELTREKKFGRYEIKEEIGQGGMGQAYQAYDTELRRIVALKLLLSSGSTKQSDKERLLREARATAKLRHPNVIAAIGTLQYMPPEQAEGKLNAIDECSDVYALGAILYELFTNRPPFSGGTSFNILCQILNEVLLHLESIHEHRTQDTTESRPSNH